MKPRDLLTWLNTFTDDELDGEMVISDELWGGKNAFDVYFGWKTVRNGRDVKILPSLITFQLTRQEAYALRWNVEYDKSDNMYYVVDRDNEFDFAFSSANSFDFKDDAEEWCEILNEMERRINNK